jgi:hypothetical protein
LTEQYLRVFAERATAREMASTLDQIDIIVEVLERQGTPLASRLRTLRQALRR